ncbi:SusC/RagA family TonB-linked outer membrane protein [Pedobacter polaris]|uniref:SusC/RagA family TonB-linked outer membrane protein n=1 Tax=Pedobacter polaris TaxID=2571273 RepID=A0A4U1CKF6_9SPHI|nr:SusC/RagA family TonB-linked outer membrane protein [Pedobacter polaris]TKC05494.1 SusC/RagA family TonB-linked outer membrane protein [Pedobacter polaris]
MRFYIKSGGTKANKHLGFITNQLNKKLTKAMKLIVIFLTAFCLQVSASAFSQKISISQKNVPLEQVLKEIKRQTGYFFLYDLDLIQQKSKPVTINVKNADLKDVLVTVLKSQPFSYEIKENTILIMPLKNVARVDIDVRGKIVDENGIPMPGASVKVKGRTGAVVSDSDGNFVLPNVDENATIVISYIGFADVEVAAKAQIGTIKLSSVANALTDVVITGYTSYKKTQSAAASSLVTADKINQVPGLTLDQILQGRVPGMSVISTSGQPGQSASVVIRGIGTVNGVRGPLMILDGVPIEAGYFQTINPDDIESATVLKDASATALYGSRGANGVIVYTTKKGKAGKVAVSYNSQYGFSNLSRPNFTMMNTNERLQFEEEIGLTGVNIGPGWTYSPKNPTYAAGTTATRARADFIIDSLRNINTDWRDIFFQKGKFQEQQVSISGGSEKLRFYNSLNYYNQEGVAINTGLKRYALRSNLDFNDDKFSGSVNVSLGYSQSTFINGEGTTSAGTPMSAVYYALPYEKPYASDGTLVHPGISGQAKYNILDQREGTLALERVLNSSNKTDQLKAIVGGSFAYQILPYLKATTRFGIDYRNSSDENYINPDSYYGSRSNTNTLGGRGRLDEASRRNFGIVSTSGLTFSKTFNSKHDVEFSALYEYIYNDYKSFGYTGFGIDSRLPETPAGITVNATFLPNLSGGKTRNAMASFMGIGRYTYDGKYTLTGSYRYDGSTTVVEKNRWHGFYSVGANWNAKQEDFLKNVELISDLKVRASYGTTASTFGGNFDYQQAYGNTTYGGNTGIRATQAGNIDYDWEYVSTFNAGFDLTLFKSNRLRLVADVYNKITSNMFINQPPSAVAGYATLPLSSGKMRNRGIEFDISGDVLKTKDFTWTIGANAGYNKNMVLRVSDVTDNFPEGDTRIIKVGLPYGTYVAPDWAGVNPQTGEAQYYNLDGSITTLYNANTQNATNSGSLYPTFTGGFNTSFNYKGITASALFSFVSDVMRHNNEDLYNENRTYRTSNQSVRMLYNRWQNPGDSEDDAILQRFDIPRNFTSKDIQDASYLRLRNVTIGYTVPKTILDKTKFIKGVKVFVQGQNLYTWTSWRGLDPENNDVFGRFQYPNTRTYTAGINVNF